MSFMGGVLSYGQVELDLSNGDVVSWHALRNNGEELQNTYLTTAYRDLDDRVYGFGYADDGQSYSFNSAEADDIDTSVMVRSLEFADLCVSLCYNIQEDMFYGVTTDARFVKVDPKGNVTPLFKLNVGSKSTLTGLVYSPSHEAYIWNAYFEGDKSAFYAIKPEEKSVTKLYDCPAGEEYIYMVCTELNVQPTAPATPTGSSYTFAGAATSGKLSFTMPGKTAAGEPLKGELQWRLLDNGKEIASGTAQAGARVEADIPAVSNAAHSFALSAGVDGKFSYPDITRIWVGSDYPEMPANVNLSLTELTWDAVTTSVHDGYLDTGAITYIIYLNGEKVGQTSDCRYAITLPQGLPYNSYTAEVVAQADGKNSEPGVSNYITYGDALKIDPSIHYRPEEKEFELFKAIDIDGNLDSEGNPRNWHFSTTMGFPSFASGADGEDLLIFPPMDFTTTDKAYLLSLEAGLIHDRDTSGSIQVYLGKEPTPEAMTQVIIPTTSPQHMLADVLKGYFAVKEAGTYYIGVLTKTNDVGIHISDMDISITDRDADVPIAITDMEVIPGADGALEAAVSFTMPTTTANGTAIADDADLTATVVAREFVLNYPDQGEVIDTKTISGKPGSRQTVNIGTQQNNNTIAVSCQLDGRSGAETTTTIFTGVVKPYIVQNLKAVVSEDNMGVTMSWTPPVEGAPSDGPIGDTFFYTLWYYGDGWQYLQEVGWDKLEAFVEFPQGAPQQAVNIGVMALNAAGQSEYITALQSVIGTPYELPMDETFPNYEDTYSPIAIQRPSADYDGTYWLVDDPAEVAALFANESGVAYIGYIGLEGVSSASSRLSLPKFTTAAEKKVVFTLNYWGGPYEAPFTLLANKYGLEKPVEIGTFPSGKGWISNSIEIPSEFLDELWIEPLLDTYFADTQKFALFCGYSISGTVGVEGVQTDKGGAIFSTPGMIHVGGHAGDSLGVYSADGRCIISVATLEDLAGFAVQPGVYIVKAGEQSKKLIVK